MALSRILETGYKLLVVQRLAANCRFASDSSECGPPNRGRMWLCETAPPEIFSPSGGITVGVRSTRDFHPRHLPSLAFLSPSTVYSSKRFACLVSYRHHLWDSKNMNGRYLLAFLTGLPWGQSRPGLQAGHAHNPEGLPARFRREKQRKPGTRWRVYPTRPKVSASLTAQTASRLNGRRAHQPAWRSRLMASCTLRTTVEMSLTRTTASDCYGRRALRQVQRSEPTTGTGHCCQPQRLHCPNDILSRPLRKTGHSAVHITTPDTPPKHS
jgi:hypothetical protein